MLYNDVGLISVCCASGEESDYRAAIAKPCESTFRTKLRGALSAGTRRGWDSFVWVNKIIVPISLPVALLQWSGWLFSLR